MINHKKLFYWFIKLPDKSIFFVTILIIFVTTLVVTSLGQIARWDLLDHIAMVDTFRLDGNLYPSREDSYIRGVSVYFPGVTLLSLALSQVAPNNYLVEMLLMLAVLLFLLSLSLQIHIANKLNSQLKWQDLLLTYIIIYLIVCRPWLQYSLEFKPDTIAFCVAVIGYYIFIKAKGNLIYVFMAGALTGSALLFKQQIISFFVGYTLYCILFHRNRINLSYISGTFTAATLILLNIKLDSNAWFWTVTVLSDDGWLSLSQWLQYNKTLLLKILLCGLAFTPLCPIFKLNKSNIDSRNITHFIRHSPWPITFSVTALAALLSSFKVGGNAGNTALAVAFVSPLVFYFIKSINSRMLALVVVISFSLTLFNIKQPVKSYQNYDELLLKITLLHIPEHSNILLGSDLYGAVRQHRNFETLNVFNYWSTSLVNNNHLFDELSAVLTTRDFSHLIIENMPGNEQEVARHSHYQLSFKNDLALVYVNSTQ